MAYILYWLPGEETWKTQGNSGLLRISIRKPINYRVCSLVYQLLPLRFSHWLLPYCPIISAPLCSLRVDPSLAEIPVLMVTPALDAFPFSIGILQTLGSHWALRDSIRPGHGRPSLTVNNLPRELRVTLFITLIDSRLRGEIPIKDRSRPLPTACAHVGILSLMYIPKMSYCENWSTSKSFARGRQRAFIEHHHFQVGVFGSLVFSCNHFNTIHILKHRIIGFWPDGTRKRQIWVFAVLSDCFGFALLLLKRWTQSSMKFSAELDEALGGCEGGCSGRLSRLIDLRSWPSSVSEPQP